jgi:hypothetical protein
MRSVGRACRTAGLNSTPSTPNKNAPIKGAFLVWRRGWDKRSAYGFAFSLAPSALRESNRARKPIPHSARKQNGPRKGGHFCFLAVERVPRGGCSPAPCPVIPVPLIRTDSLGSRESSAENTPIYIASLFHAPHIGTTRAVDEQVGTDSEYQDPAVSKGGLDAEPSFADGLALQFPIREYEQAHQQSSR